MKSLFTTLILVLLPCALHSAPAKPYVEQEVTYQNKKDVVTLAGTLTLPKSKGRHPAVLLITGSGPQDRDETIVGHKPFAVLADYLARRGIAVLRVDDRGMGKSTGFFAMCTSEDFANDALCGVAYLKARKEINPHKIGLIGHSEGGIIAPMAAVRSRDVAFIVLMAGPGVNGEEIICSQIECIMKAARASEKDIASSLDQERRIFAVLKDEHDNEAASKRIRAILLEGKPKPTADEELGIWSQTQALTLPWFRFFATYDPAPTLAKVQCPVLAINGEKDSQVPPNYNLRPIRKALEAGGNKDFTIVELLGLNHLFQRCRTGMVEEYAGIKETIAPSALEVIGDWIVKHTAPPR